VQKITAKRLEHIEKKANEKVKEANKNAKPNSWLKQAGWVQHLKEKDLKRLQEALKLADASEEPKLQAIIKSFGQVVSTAQRIAVPKVVRINALFEVNQKIVSQKPAMLFSSLISKDTLKKYHEV
jgi:hypothetical protein